MASCNAGHGCTINCPGGCGAVWVEPNGPCYTFCDGASMSPPEDVGRAEEFSIDLNDIRISQLINVLPVDFDDDRRQQVQKSEKRVTLSMRSTNMRDFSAELHRHIG